MLDPQDRVTEEETDDPRAGVEDAHEFGIVLVQCDEDADEDAGEALDVQSLAGLVG